MTFLSISGIVADMTEKIYTPNTLRKLHDKNETKHSLAKTALGLALFSTVLIGGVKIIKSEVDQYNAPIEEIGVESFHIPSGGNVINSTEIAVDKIAKDHNINESDIPNDQIVYESQKAANKMNTDYKQNFTEPGDEFSVALFKKGREYKVHVMPTDNSVADAYK